MSNGERAIAPNYSNLDRKIRSLQRKLARQQKGSNRRNKTRLSIAKLHNRITDLRLAVSRQESPSRNSR
jgi:putative transposase